ncbi:exonuclease [Moumouvirus goulette]|uniref:Exonuclease n=1 Tax=Moumouvirus goulette TaxID=1247379 RepID=M1NMT9_9VIRU|nr:exonuclease [Moumouvirus goulette]AGF85365.1 exonuclease [Moumouvirus goulette]
MNTDFEVINTVQKIAHFIKENGSTKIHILDNHIKNNNSVTPIWKRNNLSIIDFMKKFNNIFAIEKNQNVDLIDYDMNPDNYDIDTIINMWKIQIDDMTLLSNKVGHDLMIFSLDKNLDIDIVSTDNDCSVWIQNNIYEKKVKFIGFDTETNITGKVEKPSIIQISSNEKNLIVQINKMTTLPEKLYELFSDSNIIKIGVSIKNDANNITKYFSELKCMKSVLDLSDLAKIFIPNKFENKINDIGLKTLAAYILGVYVENKDLCDVKKSNWNDEILTIDQVNYAITDSWISLEMFNKLVTDSNSYDNMCKCIKDYYIELVPVKNNNKNALTKKQLADKEQEVKKLSIQRRIKKWYKDDDILELVFEPMNSFYRQFTHVTAKQYPNIITETTGTDPNRFVTIKKLNKTN